MNPLNPFAVSGLIITISFAPLFVILLLKNTSKSKPVFIFTLYAFCVLMWGVTGFFWAILQDLRKLLILWPFTKTAVIFMAVFFYHSILLLAHKNKPQTLLLIYGLAVFFSICAFQGLLWDGGIYVFNSFYYPKATLLYGLSFVSWLSIITLANIELINYYQISHPKEQLQIKYLLLLSIGFLGGATNFLPAFGLNIYPYGNFLVPVHALSVTYAILRYQLFDIQIVIRKSIIYSLAILLMSLIYLGFVYTGEQILQNFWGYKSFSLSLIAAFVIGVAFFPLHSKLQKLAEHFIFKNTPEELANENQLLRQNAQQSEKMKTIATLASSVAHEIRNPLTSLKTFVEYFPKKKSDPTFIAKFESIAATEINRIESILNDLLSFAKPSALSLTDTDVKKTLEHALNLTANQLNKNKIQVKTKFTDDLPIIKADANKLLQVFINLILNANDAMSEGGTLTIGASGLGLGVRILICDTGHGIEAKNLSKVFDPFFTTKDKGTGLGLAIVKGIVEDHGGKITVASTSGAGTTFTITLPTASGKTEAKT